VSPIPVEVDPPAHLGYRRLLVPELRPDRVADWAGTIRRAVDHAIDEFIESGTGDLVGIARYVPPAVIAAILGVPDDGPIMVELTNRLNECAMAGDAEGRALVNRELMAYLDKVVTAAKGTDRADMLGLIANATIDGEPIEHIKAVAMAMTVVIAGQETTVNGIGGILGLLGVHQNVRQQLIDDPDRIPAAVEEALRVESPVQMMGRTAAADVEVAGCPVTKGEKVGLVWGAANFDPAKFENPEEFRLDRGTNPHVAFGHGIHRCVGEHLARAEMTIAAERVLARIPDFELTGEIEYGADIALNRGVRSIPVRFTPGRRVLAD
jgi:cytochrome P450